MLELRRRGWRCGYHKFATAAGVGVLTLTQKCQLCERHFDANTQGQHRREHHALQLSRSRGQQINECYWNQSRHTSSYCKVILEVITLACGFGPCPTATAWSCSTALDRPAHAATPRAARCPHTWPESQAAVVKQNYFPRAHKALSAPNVSSQQQQQQSVAAAAAWGSTAGAHHQPGRGRSSTASVCHAATGDCACNQQVRRWWPLQLLRLLLLVLPTHIYIHTRKTRRGVMTLAFVCRLFVTN